MGKTRCMVVGMALVGAMLCVGVMDAYADQQPVLIRHQTVYVPVYSHIFIGERARPFYLAATVSIRNTDPKYPITVTSADYYDTKGVLVKRFIIQPKRINPMGAENIYIKESDTSGGAGANFVLRWQAARPVNAPIIESVMIGSASGQGISFVSRGQAIVDQR